MAIEKSFEEAHNAAADVEATSRTFLELLRQDKLHPIAFNKLEIQTVEIRERNTVFELVGISHQNLKQASASLISPKVDNIKLTETEISTSLAEAPFVHLHNHSQFSVLQATSRINQLVEAAASDNMPAVAITDHGNLMGVLHFIKDINGNN